MIIKNHRIKHVVDVRDGAKSSKYIPLYEWMAKKFGALSYTHMDANTWKDYGSVANSRILFNMIKNGYDNDENFLIIGKFDEPLECIRFSVVGRMLKQLNVLVLHYNKYLLVKDQTSLEVEMLKNTNKSPIKMKDCYEDSANESFKRMESL